MAIALMLSIKAQAFKDGVAAERARQEKLTEINSGKAEQITNTANDSWQEKTERENENQDSNGEGFLILDIILL